MLKTPDCDRCLYYSHNQYLICAVHPNRQNSGNCPDFHGNPEARNGKFVDFLNLLQQVEDSDNHEPFSNPFSLHSEEEQWEPEGASYYNGELILQPKHQRTREEQLWLLEHHPMFTGRCPSCNAIFDQDYQARVHWDCDCGWLDDSI